MGHMAKGLCAKMLAAEGQIKTHNSNGTICAVLGENVYMTCASGKDNITGLGQGKFEVVNKYTQADITEGGDKQMPVTCFRKGCMHWVLLTKETWDAALTGMPFPSLNAINSTYPQIKINP